LTPDVFVSDGCTGFPDVALGVDLFPCCRAHDLAWWLHPGDWSVWMASNVDLSVCFVGAGAWWLALPALFVVSTIGGLLFALKRKEPPVGRH
jgi:DNA-binding transcriptional LysR family regulator